MIGKLSRKWNLFKWRLAEIMWGGFGWVDIVKQANKAQDEAIELIKRYDCGVINND